MGVLHPGRPGALTEVLGKLRDLLGPESGELAKGFVTFTNDDSVLLPCGGETTHNEAIFKVLKRGSCHVIL